MNISPSGGSQLTSGATLQFTATGLNAEGSIVSGVTPTWISSEPSVASISTTGLVTASLTGTTTVTAMMSGVSSASVAVTVLPGSPAKLTIRTQPSGAVAGAPLTVQPVLEVRDEAGNVASTGAVVTAAIGSGSDTLTGTTAITAVTGIATFTDLGITGPADTVALSFSATGLASVTSAPLVVKVVATAYAVTVSTVSPTVGDTLTVTAQLEDADSNAAAIAGRTVTWGATDTSGSFSTPTSTTGASGAATVRFITGLRVGSYTVTATDSAGLKGTSPTITSVAGAATGYDVSASTTSPAAGDTVTVTAQLEDADSNAVAAAGRTVTWSATGTGGSFAAGTSTTDANGTATVQFITGPVAGSYTVTATDGTGLKGASPTITSVAGAATGYDVSASTTSPAAGDTVTVTAQLEDADSNAVAAAGRTVTWSATGTGGKFAAGTSTTDANGSATVQFITGPTVGSYTVTATDGTGLKGTSPKITSVPGAASTSTSLVQANPTAVLADGKSTSAITVTLEDANGNALTASAGTVVVAATAGSISTTTDNGNGTYGAVLTAPDSAGSVIVSATLNGDPLSATDTVAFVTNNVAGYVMSVSNTSPTAGDTVTVSAQISDSAGNPVALPGRVVTWQSSGVGGTFATATSTTDANGKATVSFTTSTTAGVATITATDANGLTGSLTLTSVAGAPAEYVVTTSTSTPVAGAAITLSAQLADANGNAVSLAGRTVSWTVAGESGGAFSAQTSQTSASGVATTSYTTGTSIGTQYTITAADADGATGSTSLKNQAGTAQSVQWTGPSHILITDSTLSLSDFTSVNQYGRTITSPTLDFVSRTGAAATVNGSGVVSPVALGQTMVVASDPSNASATDSVLVAVSESDGPVVRTDLSRFDLKSDTTFTVTLIVDMPAGDALGAITMALTWNPALLTYVSDAEAGSGVGASVNAANAANGTLLLIAASSSGFTGSVQLRTVTFRAAATTGLSGTLDLGVTELTTATTFTDLLPKTVAITYPLITR